jgi:hypothetical protein
MSSNKSAHTGESRTPREISLQGLREVQCGGTQWFAALWQLNRSMIPGVSSVLENSWAARNDPPADPSHPKPRYYRQVLDLQTPKPCNSKSLEGGR